MNTDLYSLPKDMLIKLVSTIREDTIKEVTDKYEEKFNFIMKSGNFIDECDFSDCDSLRILNNINGIKHFKCEEFRVCRECIRIHCDKHFIKTEKGYYCEECREKFVYCKEENCEKMWTNDRDLNKEYRLCLFCENPYCNDHIEETEGEWFCKYCFE